jgi:hypothetical protein
MGNEFTKKEVFNRRSATLAPSPMRNMPKAIFIAIGDYIDGT